MERRLFLKTAAGTLCVLAALPIEPYGARVLAKASHARERRLTLAKGPGKKVL